MAVLGLAGCGDKEGGSHSTGTEAMGTTDGFSSTVQGPTTGGTGDNMLTDGSGDASATEAASASTTGQSTDATSTGMTTEDTSGNPDPSFITTNTEGETAMGGSSGDTEGWEPYDHCGPDVRTDCMGQDVPMACFPIHDQNDMFLSGFCTKQCESDQDCQPAPEGSMPMCITRIGVCMLACPGGVGCPDDKTCYMLANMKGDFCF